MDTKDRINIFWFNITAKNVERVTAITSNGLGKPWVSVWVPYYDGVDGTSPIALYKGVIISKYPTKEYL